MGVVTTVIIVIAVLASLWYLGARRARAGRRDEEESSYLLGLNALIAGEREVAMKHLADAVRDDPRNVDAYVKLGNLLRERGQIKQAIQIHRELLVKRRLPVAIRSETQKSLARDLAEAGRWKEVLETLGQLPRRERSDVRVLTLMRDSYEALGDLDHAAQTHKEILKAGGRSSREPSPGVYRAHLGLLALRANDVKRARSDLQAALKEDQSAYLASLHLGDIAAKEGDNERAVAYWMRLVTDRPECAHLAFDRLEKAYFDMGDYGRMMGIYEELVSKTPTSVAALAGLSRMLERKGSIEEAIRFAREAAKHEGPSRRGHRQLLEVLVRNGRYEEAAKTGLTLLNEASGEKGQRSCPACGAPLSEHGWRCQSCRSWIHEC